MLEFPDLTLRACSELRFSGEGLRVDWVQGFSTWGLGLSLGALQVDVSPDGSDIDTI